MFTFSETQYCKNYIDFSPNLEIKIKSPCTVFLLYINNYLHKWLDNGHE